jgi:putative transposase
MLSDKIDCYQENKTMLYNTPAMYKDFYYFLKEIDSLALANVQLNLERAYKNFFKNVKVGFPKFKSKHKSKWCYTTNNLGQIKIKDGKITLPKLKDVKIIQHRQIKGMIKSCTITKTRTNKYYISIMCEYENQVSPVLIDENKSKMVGLDYSSSHFFVSSDGEIANYPKFFRKSEKKLSKALRKLSLKKNKKSKNYQKQKLKVAKIHEKIANQRNDWLHKKSRELVNIYDGIFVEDLDLKSISRCLKLGKATMDNGFGLFRNMIEYKVKEQGKCYIKIDRFSPTTKLCHVCGYKYEDITLLVRNWTCPKCNTHHNRDINAAQNILAFGREILFRGRNCLNSSVVYSGSKLN